MNIAIIEDDLIIAGLMRKKLLESKKVKVVEIYPSPVMFLTMSVRPDIVILDISLPEMDGLTAIPKILNIYPNTNIVMHTIQDDSDVIFKALQLGAIGYIDKQSSDVDFDEVIRVLENGGAYMTPSIALKIIKHYQQLNRVTESLTKRELDIVQGIMDGLSYKLIGVRHGISIDTVRMHIKNIYKKLNINSKGELFNLMR